MCSYSLRAGTFVKTEPAPGGPTPDPTPNPRPSSTPRGWRDSQLVQLTSVRFREFRREPEALFWVFIFPILMAAGLGIAFRTRGPESITVATVQRAGPGHIEFVPMLSKARD